MESAEPPSGAPDIAGEVEKLQGLWRQTAHARDGVDNPPEEHGWEPRTTFTGNTFVVTLADGSTAIKGTFTLDPARRPKTIDFTDTFGADAGMTFLAIYSLEGDRFVFCAADEKQGRPTEFRAGPGQDLRAFERVAS